MPEPFPLVPCFRDLYFVGGDLQFDRIAESIDSLITTPWSRDSEVENTRGHYLVYRRDEDGANRALRLFLSPVSGKARVTNVVPINRPRLSMADYNDAVVEFVDRFARSAAANLVLDLQLGSDQIDLRHDLDAGTIAALQEFSEGANRSTGSSHPMDLDRWYAFILKLHHSNARVSAEVLGQWLQLDGWDDDEIVADLQSEFEFAMGLLDHDSPR
jgi:hypothetical protein